MTEQQRMALKARGDRALALAGAVFAALGLGGPVMLALGLDPDVLSPMYVIGWPVVIVALLHWTRLWRARTRR